MDITQYFSLPLRRWKEILLITVLTLGFTFFGSQRITSPSYSSTLFLSLSTQRPASMDYRDFSNYDLTRAADSFTETVQGWTKSPDFRKEIYTQIDSENLSFSARKQEKQNLIIELHSSNEELTQKASQEVITILNQRIEEYNKKTNSTFVIALASSTPHTTIPQSKQKESLLIALFLGLILGGAWSFLYEYLKKKISFQFQAERILHATSIETLSKKTPLNFLKEFIKKNPNINIITTEKKSHKALKDLNPIAFPEDTSKINPEGESIIAVELGNTQSEDLRKITFLTKGKRYIVFVK